MKLGKCLLCGSKSHDVGKNPTPKSAQNDNVDPAEPSDNTNTSERDTKPKAKARKPVSLKTRYRKAKKGLITMWNIIKYTFIVVVCSFVFAKWPGLLIGTANTVNTVSVKVTGLVIGATAGSLVGAISAQPAEKASL